MLNSGAYDQNNIRLNLDHQLRDDFKLSFSGYHNRSNRQNLYGDTFFDLINQAPDVDLLVPDPDGTPYLFQGDPEGREENPLYVLATEENTRRRARTQGSIEARWTPLSWFNVDGNVSYDRSDRRNNFFLDAGPEDRRVRHGRARGDPAGAPARPTRSTPSASANLLRPARRLHPALHPARPDGAREQRGHAPPTAPTSPRRACAA